MVELSNKLKQLLDKGLNYISNTSEFELSKKVRPEKWSKKEILGHLIDSAINNLQRFTEIQFESQPYKLRNYNQNELVKINDYQNSELKDIVELWLALNNRILHIIKLQTKKTLDYKIELDDSETIDLKFLIEDYVNHLEHHLNQIRE